ncbi:M56 family metallopeptidase [bacterium]|nr:M56 family metallopeptidase [bacterium]
MMLMGMEIALRSTVVLAIAIAVTMLMARGRANVRLFILRAGILAAFGTLIVSAFAPQISVPLLPADGTAPHFSRIALPSATRSEANTTRSSNSLRRTEKVSSSLSPTAALVGIWLFGVAIGLAWLGVGFRRIVGVIKNAHPAADELPARIRDILPPGLRILISEEMVTPFVTMISGSAIVLPRRLIDEATEEELLGVVAHESAHWRHRDPLWSLGMRVLQVLFWFHPLLWVAAALHRGLCEEACDAAAARDIGDRTGYARTLARLALLFASSPRFEPDTALFGSPEILRRLRRLENGKLESPVSGRHRAIGIAGVLVVVAAAGILTIGRVSGQEAPVNAQDETSKEEQLRRGLLGDPQVAKAHEELLAEIQPDGTSLIPNAADRILALLDQADSNPEGNARASAALVAMIEFGGRLDRPELFLPRVRRLLAAESEIVRAAAVAALPYAGGDGSDVQRLAQLVDDPSDLVRMRLAMATIQCGGDATVPPAETVILKLLSEDGLVAYASIAALSTRPISPGIEEALVQLSHDPMAVGEVAFLYQNAPEVSLPLTKRMLEVWRDESLAPQARPAAALALATHPAPAGLRPAVASVLVEAYDSDSMEDFRSNLIAGLGFQGTDEAREKLWEILRSDEDDRLRERAYYGLVDMGEDFDTVIAEFRRGMGSQRLSPRGN